MYVLQVRFRKSWKWGINTYETREAAEARIRLESELYA